MGKINNHSWSNGYPAALIRLSDNGIFMQEEVDANRVCVGP